MPLATIYGEPLSEAPKALYIPPAVLRVMLDNFSGPLDLLLYLVRRHKFDILDIPMADLCRQYTIYVTEALEKENNLETAADYLAMAALLLDIKSKMLLPKPPLAETDEEDPRADLVRRLLEYEKIRDTARMIGDMPRRGRDFEPPNLGIEIPQPEKRKPTLQPAQLAAAFAAVLLRAKQIAPYTIWQKNINLRALMSSILRILSTAQALVFERLIVGGLPGASFLAILQLAAENTVSLHQEEPDADLLVSLVDNEDGADIPNTEEHHGQAND